MSDINKTSQNISEFGENADNDNIPKFVKELKFKYPRISYPKNNGTSSNKSRER